MKSYEFFIKTQKKDIDFINKTIEAYEGYGIVRTLDPQEGRIKIITLDYYIQEIKEILNDIKEKGVSISIEKEGFWEGLL